jgi:bifunctional UDP-N-acetylglucosamine pyrophosphorylase/glucosamine-1-phosphate N-acetyltransferase
LKLLLIAEDQRMSPIDQHDRRCLAVILAAGEGKRMRSQRAKVLHEIAGGSMLAHVLAAVGAAGATNVAVVIGPGQDDVSSEARRHAPSAEIFTQSERLGTAHAVLAARSAIAAGYDEVLVAFADTPLIRPETFAALRRNLVVRPGEVAPAIVALGFDAADPTGYGRMILQDGELVAIREHKDLAPEELALSFCNAGLMAFAGNSCIELLESIGNTNAQNEYYLTDAVAAARARGWRVTALRVSESEVLGVNDRLQLAAAEALMQQHLRNEAMRAGVSLADPQSVHLSFDTQFGCDVTVEPNVYFGLGVQIADGATIRAFSHLEGAKVGPRAIVGPFARLRPGAMLAEDVHIGNFVEVKASTLGAGVKANHLAYLGDAKIGARTNIGAGVITCNYNGLGKFVTEIGEACFVGVNTALVAPVTIGAGAYIGTGSVITQDVAPESLALARAWQVEKPGWAKRFRRANKK